MCYTAGIAALPSRTFTYRTATLCIWHGPSHHGTTRGCLRERVTPRESRAHCESPRRGSLMSFTGADAESYSSSVSAPILPATRSNSIGTAEGARSPLCFWSGKLCSLGYRNVSYVGWRTTRRGTYSSSFRGFSTIMVLISCSVIPSASSLLANSRSPSCG